jgi:hypothetical protein
MMIMRAQLHDNLTGEIASRMVAMRMTHIGILPQSIRNTVPAATYSKMTAYFAGNVACLVGRNA